MRVAYLGPAGTYNEEALVASIAGASIDPAPKASIFDAIYAVEEGRVERALVPFENSIEGSVRVTLDALAFDTEGVRIVGEYDLSIRHNLIARERMELSRIERITSHPQATAQCAKFLREHLPGAELQSAASTSEAVRQVSASAEALAALGSAAAADAYGCTILRRGVEDTADNVTRFVWLSRGEVGGIRSAERPRRTTLVFSELGADHPGALVDALREFSDRGVNLTRIESRPLRRGLGRYLFFIDLEGDSTGSANAEAIEALRTKAEQVRILGSYPVGGAAPLG